MPFAEHRGHGLLACENGPTFTIPPTVSQSIFCVNKLPFTPCVDMARRGKTLWICINICQSLMEKWKQKQKNKELTPAIVLEVRTTVANVQASVIAVARFIHRVFDNRVERCVLHNAIGIFAVATFFGCPARAFFAHGKPPNKRQHQQQQCRLCLHYDPFLESSNLLAMTSCDVFSCKNI